MTTQRKSTKQKIWGWLGILSSHLLWGLVCFPIGGYLGIYLFGVFPELRDFPPGRGALEGFLRGGMVGFCVGFFCSVLIQKGNPPPPKT